MNYKLSKRYQIYLLFYQLILFILTIIALLVYFYYKRFNFYLIVFVVVFSIIDYYISLIRTNNVRIEVTDKYIIKETGLFFKRTIYIPKGQIYMIKTIISPILNKMNLSKLEIKTLGYTLVISGLYVDNAYEILNNIRMVN